MTFLEFYNLFDKHPFNNINIIPFVKNTYDDLAEIIVIDQQFELIHPKVFQKTVLFVNPSFDIIDRYIMNYDTAIGVFINDIPMYARGFIDYLRKPFGSFIVVNPIHYFSNEVWTVYSWYIPFLGKIDFNVDIKLNKKPMTSTLTFCDLFFVTDNPTNLNIPVELNDTKEVDILDGCDDCFLRNVCRYRVLRSYRSIYPSCKDYAKIELSNLDRLAFLYNEIDLDKAIMSGNVKICDLKTKRRIYEAFLQT